MPAQPIAINPKTFHSIAKDAFYEALANNGLAKSEIPTRAETIGQTLEFCIQPVPDTITNSSPPLSFFERIMGVFPQKIMELHSPELNEFHTPNSAVEHLNQIESSLELELAAVVDTYLYDFSQSIAAEYLKRCNIPETEARLPSIEARIQMILAPQVKILAEICNKWHGGLVNAFKTYFGLAKVSFQKLQEATTSLNPDTIKEAIKNNKGLLGQLTQLPMILLKLFNKINGVSMNSQEPYNYASHNFQLTQGNKLEITDQLAQDFLQQAINVKNTMIPSASNKAEERSLLEEAKCNGSAGEGCYAWEAGLMERFFELMDSITCRVVDLHFRDFTSQT